MKNKYENRMGMVYKSFDVKEFDTYSRKISGYAAVFNNIDKSRDLLLKGCFSKSITERGPQSDVNDKIIFLWQHDMREPIGRITELREDEKGLYFEAVIDEIEEGDRALKQLESGTLNQFSIGYSYVWEMCEWDNERDCLIVKEVKLYEISVVSIGCNGMTEYLGLKSAEDYRNAYEELTKEVSDMCRSLSARKQAILHNIVAKAMSLAAFRPEAKKVASREEGKADRKIEKKSLFNLIRVKNES